MAKDDVIWAVQWAYKKGGPWRVERPVESKKEGEQYIRDVRREIKEFGLTEFFYRVVPYRRAGRP